MKRDKRYTQAWKKLCQSASYWRSRQRVDTILRTPNWKAGKSLTSLPLAVADRLGVPASWIIPTNSCTSALQNVWRDTPPSVPLMTYSATWPGASAVRVDCDDDGWPTKNVRVAVDLWGRKYPGSDFYVLDAAHRFCAPEHKGLLEAGVTICYSTGPMKQLAGFEGGFYCKKMEQGEREEAIAFFSYGQRDRVPTGRGGINGMMNEVCAGFLIKQLMVYDHMQEQRQRILETYENYLGNWMMTKPGEASGHLAVLRAPDIGTAKRIKSMFWRAGVEFGHHYPIAEEHKYTNAYQLSQRILSLPCHTRMIPKQAARIAQRILTVT